MLRRTNFLRCEFEYEQDDPEGFRSGVTRVSSPGGGRDLAVKVFDLPPGQSICPYH